MNATASATTVSKPFSGSRVAGERKSRWLPLLVAGHLVCGVLFVTDVAELLAADSEPLRIRVLCYNIHHCRGIDGRLDVERIADVIKSVSPDIVSLQEVDRNTTRSEQVDQPAELARLTNMHVVFERNIKHQGGDYGNAILSKLPTRAHKNHFLPLLDNGEQRGLLTAEIDWPRRDERLLFWATHLDHRADDRERLASADFINELADKHPAAPTILAGDLNAVPESDVLKRFGKMWTRANKEILPTIPVGKPERQIDYILFRPADRWSVIEVRVLDEAIASDHRPIFAVLELKPAPATK